MGRDLALAALVSVAFHVSIAKAGDENQGLWASQWYGAETLSGVPEKGRRTCGRYVLYCPVCDLGADAPWIAYDVSTKTRVAALSPWGVCQTPQGLPEVECKALWQTIKADCDAANESAPNTTPHTDARDVPASASGSAARTGGRER
jgi:hypothetical protein